MKASARSPWQWLTGELQSSQLLDLKLSFHAHMQFYTNKVASTCNALCMLGNSAHGFHPINKWQLYIVHVIPLMLYGTQLWWNPQ